MSSATSAKVQDCK